MVLRVDPVVAVIVLDYLGPSRSFRKRPASFSALVPRRPALSAGYIFTAPMARPRTRWRWINTVRISTGTVISVAVAVIAPQSMS